MTAPFRTLSGGPDAGCGARKVDPKAKRIYCRPQASTVQGPRRLMGGLGASYRPRSKTQRLTSPTPSPSAGISPVSMTATGKRSRTRKLYRCNGAKPPCAKRLRGLRRRIELGNLVPEALQAQFRSSARDHNLNDVSTPYAQSRCSAFSPTRSDPNSRSPDGSRSMMQTDMRAAEQAWCSQVSNRARCAS